MLIIRKLNFNTLKAILRYPKEDIMQNYTLEWKRTNFTIGNLNDFVSSLRVLKFKAKFFVLLFRTSEYRL